MQSTSEINRESLRRVHFDANEAQEISRPSLSYGQDVWRRFKKNKLAIVGLLLISLILFLAIFGFLLTPHNYSDQDLSMTNLPPWLACYTLDESSLLYIHKEYTLYRVTPAGRVLERLTQTQEDVAARTRTYVLDGQTVTLDYSGAAKAAKARKDGDIKLAKSITECKIEVNGQVPQSKKVWNKVYPMGTDYMGRDMFARLIYGARISLLVAFVATFVQFFIGVLYGGIAGYCGGRVDNIMMRIVDIISTVPLTLYVVLLMVVLKPGIKTIIIALASVYWVGMARQVRGQILSIKQQEFVLAAKTIGTSTWRIMRSHLIPNAMGSIIVTLAMNIPSAIFTESFLSFIGLGVSAPAASWGTLASDALGGLRSYPYQLFFPSLFICLTVLAFNFLGDGLRDALDPKQRK